MRNRAYDGWLQYEPVKDSGRADEYRSWCGRIVVAEQGGVLDTAKEELAAGIERMLGKRPALGDKLAASPARQIVIGTAASWQLTPAERYAAGRLPEEGYLIRTETDAPNYGERLVIVGRTGRGVLYGCFHLLRLLVSGEPLGTLDIVESPKYGLRMINHWDNMDGSIERGYAGRSIFFDGNRFVEDRGRIVDYARLLASVGINGLTINNVNVHEVESRLIDDMFLGDVAEAANIFRAYGIRLYLSANYAAPITVGGLTTADPLDPSAAAWWKDAVADVYRHVPDFGGFVVKADSEGRPGPFTYGRDHADGANMLAEALAPYGGAVIWRCFVYDCRQDWRDRKTDRARAAYDHFKPLDGRFRDNVILQIKNGPMDFQVREPVSPLFGSMDRTRHMLEFQITQEYTGQQRHLCYLVPQWKETLDFDTHAKGEGSPVKSLVAGITAVSNIGDDANWTGHLLAQANLYGFGRLIWNPELTAEVIACEWVRLTFGRQPQVTVSVTDMLMRSRRVYENYTAPLGVGWMVNPGHHYGPNVDGYEYSVWGTYHYADCTGIGVDRTKATGTAYSQQYCEPNASMYDSLETCPDELLLFFHHVPYTHRLHSGETVIQHIYNTHFDGAEQAEGLVAEWRSLEGFIDDDRFTEVLERLRKQAGHAKEWRDIINTYFLRKSGIPDERGRTIY
ncbi:MAG TPA: alpha-glucuronidase family glycosyl hydrolase [Paenibacillus sp.]|uniref:alpha-glucuronidase family glycosyl hydrolase n=1 Tax=Paenibacillus sp. TaxID=58172 RepID=UPI002CBA9E00|nr:alpha-glucuronidase family glycosyl hydrolase [Paenibacillus sp.]HUC93715.1 alpha-glucuronidase family glycosyl hydrolase [Paenibacillus sp.]